MVVFTTFLMIQLWVILYFTDTVFSLTKRQFRIYDVQATWNGGYDLCRSNGGQLLKFDSNEIQKVLRHFKDSESSWNTDVQKDFWVGMNTDATNNVKSSDFINDDCQPFSSTTTPNWEGSLVGDKPCVLLKRDTLKWFQEVCKQEQNVMCDIPKGDCTYEQVSISCTLPVKTTTESPSSNASCASRCNTLVSDGLNCYAYRFIGSQCTTYHTDDPYFCSSSGSSSSSFYLRRCFEYAKDTVTYNEMYSNDLNPIRRSTSCTSWDPPTTTISTTTPTTTPVGLPTTTDTETTEMEGVSTEGQTTEAQTSRAQTMEVQTTEVHTTEAHITTAQTTEAQTTEAQNTEAQTTVAQTTKVQTEVRTTRAQTTETQTSIEDTTSNLSEVPTSTLQTAEQETPTQSTLERETSEPTTEEITQSTTNQEVSSDISTQGSTQEQQFPTNVTLLNGLKICICDTCVSRNFSLINEHVQELLAELTLDATSLSSTRRKKESEPDSRLSAKSIGYLGIFLFVGLFGTIFITDIGKIYNDVKSFY
ncbi:hypothetical protein SNE40_012956 [Patella caerulea]|uniref:C-type lectin domain-containing protein n=1 Tax=Patella caerulea TaxID=87958 RepID=A0AAN8JJY1_PATCE